MEDKYCRNEKELYLLQGMSASSELSTQTTLKALTPMEVFNLPLVNGYFLVDTRPREQFQQAKIMLSVNCPPDTVDVVAALKASWEEIGPDIFDLIVIYDYAGLTEHSWRVILECNSDALASIGLARTARVVTIAGGFQSFHAEYPLLCDFPALGLRAFSAPLPRQLTPFIFQGYCVHATPEILKGLNIKRVINMTKSLESCPHFVYEPTKFSISYLKCPIGTINRLDMAHYFISMWEFIKEGVERGEKTLVMHCEYERSPSFHCLAIVAAYLMLENKWRYEQAAQHIKQIRPWDHRCAFIEELHLLERFIFEGRALPSNN